LKKIWEKIEKKFPQNLQKKSKIYKKKIQKLQKNSKIYKKF